jgi:SAM-dependent methyltransferase
MKEFNLAELTVALNEGMEIKAFPAMSVDDFINYYWAKHPRYCFFKGLPFAAHLLDSGCGSGGLVFWRNYDQPQRDDMVISGVDLMPDPTYRDRLKDFVCQDLNQAMSFESESFDAVLSSHVIEHIDNRDIYLAELARVLKPSGLVYIECPSPASALIPPKLTLTAGEHSIKLPISNFFDDSTHLSVVTESELIRGLKKHGFTIMQYGSIHNEFLAKALIQAALQHDHIELATYGIWLLTAWSHFVIAKKD